MANILLPFQSQNVSFMFLFMTQAGETYTFPLGAGSLLVMKGATQEDWEVNCTLGLK